MSLKRLTGAALAILIAFSVQAAHGAPLRATRTLRATWCCATTCHHASSTGRASQCCRSASDAGDTATLQTAPTVREPAAVALGLSPRVADMAPAVLVIASAPVVHARGAPTFLLVRSLRL